ncbi:hypothetical protein GQ53DRAFT_848384 [Thozetella sp. PMI_491]|nr:hypothetical protein GQ53DRAFT_848384 [Thozetella sp. PMI_491]
MRSLSLLPLTILLWCAGVVVAQADLASRILQATPKCALPCVLGIFSSGICSTDSIAPCICTNTTLQADLSICVQGACIFDDQLKAVAIETGVCEGYPVESRSNEVKLTIIVCCALVFPFVLLRFFARIYITQTLWVDDYVILAASFAQAALAGIEFTSAKMGFGKHYWQIDPADGEVLLRYFWIVQMLYIFIQVFTKIAILLLLGRVFPTRGFQLIIKIGSALLVLHGVIFFFIDAFQCVPVSSIWDRTITAKRCVDITALGYAGAVFSIVEDLLLLLIPVPWVWGLQMNTRKRIGVLVLFSLGSFATVTSMIRLKYLVKFSRSFDSTWDNVDVVIWSLIEEFAAILCGSLPAVWPLITRLAPRLLSTNKSDADNGRATKDSLPPSVSTNRRFPAGRTGFTEIGGSEEELQQLPDKTSDKASQSDRPPLTPVSDTYGSESNIIGNLKV